MNALRSPAKSFPSMPAFPRDDETVLGKLRDKRIDNTGHLAVAGEHRALPFVGSPVFQHFRGYLQLVEAAKPTGDGLQLADDLVQLVAQCRRGAGFVGDHGRVKTISRGPPLVVAN